jgi:hypothetical protein
MSGLYESSFPLSPHLGERENVRTRYCIPQMRGPTPRQGAAAPWNPASIDIRKTLSQYRLEDTFVT